jgi:hypothetical protein
MSHSIALRCISIALSRVDYYQVKEEYLRVCPQNFQHMIPLTTSQQYHRRLYLIERYEYRTVYRHNANRPILSNIIAKSKHTIVSKRGYLMKPMVKNESRKTVT